MLSESGLLNAVKNSYPSYNTRVLFCFRVCPCENKVHAVSLPTCMGNSQLGSVSDSLHCFQCVNSCLRSRNAYSLRQCIFIKMFIKIKPQPLSLENVENSVGDVKSTGQHPGFQRAIGPAGEDPVAWDDVDLHDASPEVSEYGLLSVLISE